MATGLALLDGADAKRRRAVGGDRMRYNRERAGANKGGAIMPR
jgi:hypothetical protein